MSDILKKLKDRREREGESLVPLESAQPEMPTRPSKPPKEKIPSQAQQAPPEEAKVAAKSIFTNVEKKRDAEEGMHEPQEVRISSVVMKESKIASYEESEKLYNETLSLVNGMIKDDKVDYNSIDIRKIAQQVDELVSQLSLGNEDLLMFSLTKDSLNSHYIFGHMINVCIISVKVGIGLGYEKSKLMELGISAILHDIGMANCLSIANQPRKLTASEYEGIKKHTIEGLRNLEKIKDAPKVADHVAEQHHERIDGSGYLKALKGDMINEFAKIISVVDVYEAMMHPRVYRKENPSLETMRELITNKKTFDYKILKVLIENIGILPIGSRVELNTKEVAQVVKLNHKYPLRPVIRVIYDTEGNKLKEPRLLNLATQCNIYAEKCVSIKKGVKGKDSNP